MCRTGDGNLFWKIELRFLFLFLEAVAAAWAQHTCRKATRWMQVVASPLLSPWSGCEVSTTTPCARRGGALGPWISGATIPFCWYEDEEQPTHQLANSWCCVRNPSHAECERGVVITLLPCRLAAQAVAVGKTVCWMHQQPVATCVGAVSACSSSQRRNSLFREGEPFYRIGRLTTTATSPFQAAYVPYMIPIHSQRYPVSPVLLPSERTTERDSAAMVKIDVAPAPKLDLKFQRGSVLEELDLDGDGDIDVEDLHRLVNLKHDQERLIKVQKIFMLVLSCVVVGVGKCELLSEMRVERNTLILGVL